MATKRVSLIIGEELNNWLDEESKKTGFTKNALCHMAVERYKEQREGLKQVKALESLTELLESMQSGNTDIQTILENVKER
ncbi:hypothetical protein [Aquibacillus saliphilus]|uniref:hypothetical protein n=1 Tax=Aquibacillus saliphilus TaxID=1909422 RepID=UPI001CF081AA|nr:hypothetical protein [Aquibacillus saliphilus]